MQRILRTIPLVAVLAAMLLLAGCGGDDKVSSEESPQELLDKTFTGKKDIKSGKVDVKIDFELTGEGSPLQGPAKLTLSGPFESQGEGKLPKFDIDASFQGAGQSLKAGVLSSGDKGFVSFQGTDYEVSPPIFSQFKTAYEQAAKQSQGKNQDQSLASLGIDPRRWLTNARNEGEAKVGDADTVKLTGEVDISKLLDDVNTALAKASSLGLGAAGAGIPTKITDEQKKQVEDSIKDLDVQIFTGKDDAILRRIVIALDAKDPSGSDGAAKITVDFSLLELNDGQEFKTPDNAKPLDELLQSLGGLGLGGLGGGGSSGGGSSGSGGGSSGSGSGAAELEEYTKCVEDAGNDLEKAQKCAELLTP